MDAEERLADTKTKLSDKREVYKKCLDKIKKGQALSKKLKREIAALEKEVGIAELECLGEVLGKNGIAFSDIISAVECGLFASSEKKDEPPAEDDTNGAGDTEDNSQSSEKISTTSESEVNNAISDS